MKKLLFVLLMLLGSQACAAPFLAWDAVTTDTTGSPLPLGLEVTSYKVYRCGTSLSGPCLAPDRALVGTVLAPAQQSDAATKRIFDVLAKVVESQKAIQSELQEDDKEMQALAKALQDVQAKLGQKRSISVKAPSGNTYQAVIE